MITKNEYEILKTIKYDTECLILDLKKDDNQYHYDLLLGNINDLINDNIELDDEYEEEENYKITCDDCGKRFRIFDEGGCDDERCDTCWKKNQDKLMLKTIQIKNENDFPNGEWVTISNEKFKGEVLDEDIYFYVNDNINLNELEIGQDIELDEKFKIIDIERLEK